MGYAPRCHQEEGGATTVTGLGGSVHRWVDKTSSGGWRQVGYGVFFGADADCNFAVHVPVAERQSVSRGELQGGLHALFHCKPGERLVVVLDSMYVYRGITEWLLAHLQRAGGAQGLVGTDSVGARKGRGPSHLGVEGNVGADQLAE